MISGPFRGQRLNTLGGHMEVIKKRVNKFGTRSVKQISPKLLTLISPKMFTLISPRTKISSAPETHRSGQKAQAEGRFRIHHQNDSTVAVQKSQNQLEYTGRSVRSQDKT